MKTLFGLILMCTLAACSTCKSGDSPEVCRSKQRDKMQRHSDMAALPSCVAPRLTIQPRMTI